MTKNVTNKVNEKSVSTLFETSLQLRAEGKFDEAIQNLDQAEKLSPGETEQNRIMFLRGLIYFETGSSEQAIANLMLVKGRLSGLPELHQMIGAAYQQLGDYERAVDFFSIAISQEFPCDATLGSSTAEFPNTSEFHESRAAVYIIMGEYEKALTDLNFILERCSQSSHGFYQRGELYLKMGNDKAAGEDFNRAIIAEAENKTCYRKYHLEYFFDNFSEDFMANSNIDDDIDNCSFFEVRKQLRLTPIVRAAYEKRAEAYKNLKELEG